MVSTKKAILTVRRARNAYLLRVHNQFPTNETMKNISRMERYGVNVNNNNNTIAAKVKLIKRMSEKNKAILTKFMDPYVSNTHLVKRIKVLKNLPAWFKGSREKEHSFYNVYLKPVYNAYVKKFAKKYNVNENLIRSVNIGIVSSRGGKSVNIKSTKKNYPLYVDNYLIKRWKRGTQRRTTARQRLESRNVSSLRSLPPNVTRRILTMARVNPSLMNKNYMSSANRYRQRMFEN